MNDEAKLSVVYFLLDEDTGLVKVGFTVDTERRLRQLSGPRWMRYIGWVPGGRREESAMHASLSQYRVHGEWFRLPPHILSLVEGVCAAQRQRLDAEEEEDVLRALQATHDIVCKRKACEFA